MLKIKKMNHFPSCGVLPSYQTEGAAGMDIRAYSSSSASTILGPGETMTVETGLCMEIPDGYEIQVRSRSGLAAKNSVHVLNSPGTIDSDYRGEIKIILKNSGKDPFEINNGDRVAQLVLAKVEKMPIVVADDLSSSWRNDGGLGSTGVN